MTITAPIKIPLYVFTVSGNADATDSGNSSQDEYKIGIKVSLDGGSQYKMYEFDTGGSGFWAAGNTNWWSGFTPVANACPATINYSSGIEYTATPVTGTVNFETIDAGALSIQTNISQITAAERNGGSGNNAKDQAFDAAWKTALDDSNPNPPAPLYGQFFGDFGMGLAPFESKNVSGSCLNTSLFAVLPQLLPSASSTDLLSGFIINVSPKSDAQNYIQIGLTPDDLSNFSTFYPMQLPASPSQAFPSSNVPTFCEELVTGYLSITPPVPPVLSVNPFPNQIGVVFDTGAPTGMIHTDAKGTASPAISIAALNPYLEADLSNSNAQSTVKTNNTLTVSTDSYTLPQNSTQPVASNHATNLLDVNPVGSESSINQITATTLNIQASGSGYLNTGLIPYFNGQVLYYFPYQGSGYSGEGFIAFNPYSAAKKK